jgi:hypothetical protein
VELGEVDKPCDVLCGWLMLSCIKRDEDIDRCSFCSLGCLKIWMDKQLPGIPDVFIESLDEERSE